MELVSIFVVLLLLMGLVTINGVCTCVNHCLPLHEARCRSKNALGQE